MSSASLTPEGRDRAITANRWVYRFSRYWLLIFSLFYGLFVGLPFLSPVFMKIGWESAGRAVYLLYTFLCYQLPQRSLFFFGQKTMYGLTEIQAAWQDTINPLILRQFIGNAEMGWKMAWSDRMVSMYASILVFAWIWYPLRKKVRPLPWWGFILLIAPMAVDGFTHMVSDIAGIGLGFRDSNQWLSILTNHAFSSTFYTGDALGSFNSLMRWITGTLFGIGVVWFGFPYLDAAFSDMAATIKAKFQRADLTL